MEIIPPISQLHMIFICGYFESLPLSTPDKKSSKMFYQNIENNMMIVYDCLRVDPLGLEHVEKVPQCVENRTILAILENVYYISIFILYVPLFVGRGKNAFTVK